MQLDKAADDTTKARLYSRNGAVDYYEDQSLAYMVWLGTQTAFRGANDTRPVYGWECNA